MSNRDINSSDKISKIFGKFSGLRRFRQNPGFFQLAASCLILLAVSSAVVFYASRSFRDAKLVNKEHGQQLLEPQQQVLGAFSDLEPQQAAPVANPAPSLNPLVSPPQISAQSALVFALNGPILYSYNPTEKLPIASLTKLMTALVVMGDPRFPQPITITDADHVITNPVLHLKTGDQVYPANLVQAMLVGSANDAALALANHFGTPDKTFIEMMNERAAALGMTSTNYSTPIGFDDPGNYSNVLDLQKLINAALPILPFAQTDHADAYSFNSIGPNPTNYSIKATSFLPDSNSEIGVLKTGFTDNAKQAMVAQSSIQGQKIISIILESNNRDSDTAALINYVGTAYLWSKN